MPNYTLKVYKKPDLTFEGEMLADESSRATSDGRFWQEVRIYRTTRGKYVTEVLRNTSLPDEPVIRTVKVGRTAEDVVRNLFRRDGKRRYLTTTARDALAAATMHCPEIGEIDPDTLPDRIQ